MGLSNIELRAVAGEIKKLVPFREAAERYGLEFDRSGFCRCPFHNERTASFRAYPDSGHCFGCGWDGDIFDLVGGLLGISFRDTVSRVNDDLGLGYPTDRRATLRERAELSARARALVKAREAEKAKEEADFRDMLEYHRVTAILAQAPPGSPEYIEALVRSDSAAYLAACAEERDYQRRCRHP
mgnify:FL=1